MLIPAGKEMASIKGLIHNNFSKKQLEDLTLGLDGVKLSAVAKASAISKVVTDVTIGPNSKINGRVLCSDISENTKREKTNSVSAGSKTFPSETLLVNGTRINNMGGSGDCCQNTEVANKSSRSIMKLMFDLDQERQMEVKGSIKECFLKMEEDSRNRRLELFNKNRYLQRETEAKFLREEQLILRQQQEEEIRASQRQQQLAQEHKQHAQHLNEWNQRMKEEERKQKEAEEEERRKLKEKRMHLEKIYQFQMEYRSKYEQIAEAAKSCKDRQAFVGKVSSHTTRLKSLNEAMEQLVKQCKVLSAAVMDKQKDLSDFGKGQIVIARRLDESISEMAQHLGSSCSVVVGEMTNLDVKTASTIVQQADSILHIFREEAGKINEELNKAVAEVNRAKEEEKARAAEEQAVSSVLTSDGTSEGLNDFVDKESFQTYVSVQQHLQTFENSYEDLMKDDKLKKFKFECQKAVNIPVNAISPMSSQHLLDKLVKLSRLISGQPVEVGHGQVNAASHPQGIAFCKNLLARKFVWQGELTVSSKPEAAFAIAAVIVALWADFPDFGQLVLGHFHRECPYLVPIFMPQVEGQSNEDYYRSLGYHYNENGEVEKQDKFLKRMSGIMRLYAAILITRPCRYQKNKIHPHGLSEAWHWISCMLNMDPRPDISATLMYDFLEVAGNSLYTHYGKQFQKLLHLICKEYFPKIEKVTASVSSGPMIRLEAFLQKILKQGHIPLPVGMLPPNFW